MNNNQYYKNQALAALKGNWTSAVLATVIYLLLTCLVVAPTTVQSFRMQSAMTTMAASDPAAVLAASSGSGWVSLLIFVLEIFILFPLSVGFVNALRLLLERGDNAVSSNMFKIATTKYLHKVWAMFLMMLYICLWSLLLIIPGLIKAYSYAMTPYILEEHPELSANEAIDRSRAMMKGHKFDLFWLHLSFIGWMILGFVSLGIGYFWLAPYMQTAQAAFYEDLKAEFGDGVINVVKPEEVR